MVRPLPRSSGVVLDAPAIKALFAKTSLTLTGVTTPQPACLDRFRAARPSTYEPARGRTGVRPAASVGRARNLAASDHDNVR
jgi:hypothetical protein